MGRLGRVKEVNKAGGMKKVNKGDREKLGRRDSIGERWKEKGKDRKLPRKQILIGSKPNLLNLWI